MNKWMLTAWLLGPFAVVGALALLFAMNPSEGRRNPHKLIPDGPGDFTPATPAPSEHEIPTPIPAPISNIGTPSLALPSPHSLSFSAQPESKPASNMVTPESLPQGFIIVVDDKQKVATNDSPIYLASNHSGWNPADPKWKLSPRSDMRWQIVVDKLKLDSRMSFKFTRGSWETVETTADLKDVDNRMLPLVDAGKLKEGEKPIIELTIESWRDKRPWEPGLVALNRYRPISVAPKGGTLRRLEVVGGGTEASPGVSLWRDALVWLPPGYYDPANAAHDYPVLYLQDGQNVFEKLPTVPAEWGVDETALRLIRQGTIEEIVIVAIPHAFAGRREEYAPTKMFDDAGVGAPAYTKFLVEEVMPRVERAFRVKRGAEYTGIGGSSMGALVSLYAATEHPELFGKVIVFSPALMARDQAPLRFFEGRTKWPDLVYFVMGGKEAGTDPADEALNRQYLDAAKSFDRLLESKVLLHKTTIDPGAVHNEVSWNKWMESALSFCFPRRE
jgi:predicted alpha/beta superfamily hydrolase